LADEILVLDSGSSDGTEAIAREYGARWETQEWLGFVGQKNRALELATHEWVLSLDADEALSPLLIEELKQLKDVDDQNLPVAYRMPRCVFYDEKWIRHGDWYPDRLVRLFRREQAKYTGGKVHERLEVEGQIATLKGDIEHFSFIDSQDHRERGQKYAQLWAESALEKGKRSTCLDPLSHAAYRWLRGYVLRAGFLDGAQGWNIAWLSTREVYLKYRLLRQMSRNHL
tara:strand:+ start:392 stop:1075 length:684 start_codon:yes stop_codon:yes gene_type:complete